MRQLKKPIMLVEDNPIDYQIILRAFQKSGIEVELIHCEDGDKALDYLLQRDTHFMDAQIAPRPCMILLDLHIPKTNGKEVLRHIKSDPVLKSIPVIVFTSSNHPKDVKLCYEYGANCYLQKPLHFSNFQQTLELLMNFFFNYVILADV